MLEPLELAESEAQVKSIASWMLARAQAYCSPAMASVSVHVR